MLPIMGYMSPLPGHHMSSGQPHQTGRTGRRSSSTRPTLPASTSRHLHITRSGLACSCIVASKSVQQAQQQASEQCQGRATSGFSDAEAAGFQRCAYSRHAMMSKLAASRALTGLPNTRGSTTSSAPPAPSHTVLPALARRLLLHVLSHPAVLCGWQLPVP